MKKKIVILNVILIVYILSLSVGYAIFSESLTVSGVATTVEYYSGTNLPVTAQLRDATNNLYHTSTGTDILEYDNESWQDDTYEVTYIKNSTGTSGSTASFTVSFDNAAVLDMTEGHVSTDANALVQSENPIVLANNTSGVVTPLLLQSNSSEIQTVANTSITASATISKTELAPDEIVDVTVTIGLDSLTAGVNESVTATVAYMLQNKIRYFYFKVNLNDACLTKGHDYTTTTVASTLLVRGYNSHTCTRCGDSYTDNYATSLTIVNSSKVTYTAGSWSGGIVNRVQSTGGISTTDTASSKFSSGNPTVSIQNSSTTSRTAVFYIKVNLDDVTSITYDTDLWDTGYSYSILSSKIGTANATIGLTASQPTTIDNSGYTSGTYKSASLTRSSSSDSLKALDGTIDTSSLSGVYYIKIYLKHSMNSGQAYGAYLRFNKLILNYG